jgi:hypothetical protein
MFFRCKGGSVGSGCVWHCASPLRIGAALHELCTINIKSTATSTRPSNLGQLLSFETASFERSRESQMNMHRRAPGWLSRRSSEAESHASLIGIFHRSCARCRLYTDNHTPLTHEVMNWMEFRVPNFTILEACDRIPGGTA